MLAYIAITLFCLSGMASTFVLFMGAAAGDETGEDKDGMGKWGAIFFAMFLVTLIVLQYLFWVKGIT